jgi:hypothetical protein
MRCGGARGRCRLRARGLTLQPARAHQQIALRKLHTTCREIVPLRLRFHAFGDHGHVQLIGECDDRVQHRATGGLLADAADKCAIDFESVDLQLLKGGEAAVPRTEIVNRNAPATVLQCVQSTTRHRVHKVTLRELQQHTILRERVRLKQLCQSLRQLTVRKLLRCDIE